MPARWKSLESCLATAVTSALVLGLATTAASATEAAGTMSGQVVVIDKQTGKLRGPTAEEAAELKQKSRKRSTSTETVEAMPTVHVDAAGVMSAQLGEEYESTEVVHVGPDGKTVHSCVHGPEAAQSRLANPPATLETE